MRKREYVWFIEPLDSATNEVLSREIRGERFCREAICEDGKKRNLWVCSWSFVSAFKKSKSALALKFKVFNCCSGGKIREFKFPYLRKRKKQSRFWARKQNCQFSSAVFLFSLAGARKNNPSEAPSRWRGAKESNQLFQGQILIYVIENFLKK